MPLSSLRSPRSHAGTERPSRWGALLGAAAGALAARVCYAGMAGDRARATGVDQDIPDSPWTRVNFRGERVTLVEGPALAMGTCAATACAPGLPARLRLAGMIASAGAGGFGAYDDRFGSGAARGFRGHLGALARGEITTGAVKILGIGVTGAAAAAALDRRPVDLLLNTALIAGGANLVNLFDLRPGRAVKVGLLAGAPALVNGHRGAVAAPALGAAAALLPEDLGERAMLGDSGANALGAVLGVAAAAALPRPARAGLLVGITGLTAASEVVSFSGIINATPPLRRFDGIGRRPAPARPTPSEPPRGDAVAGVR